MGILDETQFDLGSYGGSPSGWLGALLQPQSGPAPGFVPDATQMPPSFPPTAAAAGMAKGAVTPQIGAVAMGKDPGASNASPGFLANFMNGIGSPFMSGPAVLPNLLDRLMAGATNFATGGSPIGGVLNSVRGLATGERTDPAGIRQANQSSTFNALVGAGVAPQVAQIAALNPEILKTIVAAHFKANPPQEIGSPGAGSPPAPISSAVGRADVEAAGSQAPADTGQDAGLVGRAGPAIPDRLPASRPAQADVANEPARPLDARLANPRRQLLSGPAVLPLVRTPRPPH